MNKQQLILTNPFHPLDLSAADILVIFRRFQQSRKINKNPKHQLPLEIIAQLIASLKGCRPSEVQKIMAEAIIKDSISWNDFLLFLDHERLVRADILQWLLHEKSLVKYNYQHSIHVRQKIQRHYEAITFLKTVHFQGRLLMILTFDRKKTHLLSIQKNHRIVKVDEYQRFSSKTTLEPQSNQNLSLNQQESKVIQKSVKNPSIMRNKKLVGSQRLTNREVDMSLPSKSYLESSNARNLDQQAEYIEKERKNISGMFNLFRDLPLQQSMKVARFASKRISQRTITANNLSTLRDNFVDVPLEKYNSTEKAVHFQAVKPLETAHKKLRVLYKQKSYLSYNPYNGKRQNHFNQDEFNLEEMGYRVRKDKTKDKKIFERRGKQYFQQAMFQSYSEQLRCLLMVYYNMEVVMVKISQDYNKTVFEEQDTLKLSREKDNKKNQTVQAIRFYYHSITRKWLVLVLVRTSWFKSEYKSHYECIVKGYEIKLAQRRNHDFSYLFKSKQQLFSIKLDREVIGLQVQPKYGIHLISNSGSYIFLKEQFRDTTDVHQYFQIGYVQDFKQSAFSLSCFAVSSQLNKGIFGTVNGKMICYDLFSHQFKTKKISNHQIVQIQIVNNKAYLLSTDQKIHVHDIDRSEEIQCLDARNEQKLHQKVFNFDIYGQKIYSYGTEVKIYSEYTDQSIQHQSRKLNNMYTWRMAKLADKKQPKKAIPSPIKYEFKSNSEMVIESESYFVILSEILEAVIIIKSTLKIKFTFVLGVPYDARVMKMVLSADEKLLCLLLFDQNIYIFNIHTQQLFLHIKPSPKHKYSTISFLDTKNEYLLAAGTDSGAIALIPFPSVPQRQIKTLQFHSKQVTLTAVAKNFMITSSQDKMVAIWQLPFNILKHEIRVNVPNYLCQQIGYQGEYTYLHSLTGKIKEFHLKQGKLTNTLFETSEWTVCAFDHCTEEFLGVDPSNTLIKLGKKKLTNKWEIIQTAKLPFKSKVIHIGIIPTEKAVIFTDVGQATVYSYHNKSFSKPTSFHN